jgi:hypothetical protein
VPFHRHHSLRATSARSYERTCPSRDATCPSRDATTYIATS